MAMSNIGQRPFTASQNKFAYAQAFTTPTSTRIKREGYTHALLIRGLSAVRGRAKADRSA